MRALPLSLIILASLISHNISAVEPIIEPHAMIYYQIPLGGYNNSQKKHSFGFRLDRVGIKPGNMLDYQRLAKQTALFDFRMEHGGVKAISVSGVNYLKRFTVLRANEDETGDMEITDDEETISEDTMIEEETIMEQDFMEVEEFTVEEEPMFEEETIVEDTVAEEVPVEEQEQVVEEEPIEDEEYYPEEEAYTGPTMSERINERVSSILSGAPLGVYMGIIFGIGLLAGAGG